MERYFNTSSRIPNKIKLKLLDLLGALTFKNDRIILDSDLLPAL